PHRDRQVIDLEAQRVTEQENQRDRQSDGESHYVWIAPQMDELLADHRSERSHEVIPVGLRVHLCIPLILDPSTLAGSVRRRSLRLVAIKREATSYRGSTACDKFAGPIQ